MKLRRKTEAKIEQVASAMELDTNAVMQVLRESFLKDVAFNFFVKG